jgi:hypothetical protein
MHFNKAFVIDELRKQGKSQHVQKAIDELPDKIDHEQHAGLLKQLGLDPGVLAQTAAKKGLSALES